MVNFSDIKRGRAYITAEPMQGGQMNPGVLLKCVFKDSKWAQFDMIEDDARRLYHALSGNNLLITMSEESGIKLAEISRTPPRDYRGSKHQNALLSEKKVLEIRKYYDEGTYNMRQLSEIYNVSQSTISAIIHRINWKHI
jgi:hypothetical protein